MAICKFCDKPVIVGKAFHSDCWAHHVKKLLTEQFCDQYCRFPRECDSDIVLAEYCAHCPLANIYPPDCEVLR